MNVMNNELTKSRFFDIIYLSIKSKSYDNISD